jgi:hypothetical protein
VTSDPVTSQPGDVGGVGPGDAPGGSPERLNLAPFLPMPSEQVCRTLR